MTTELPPRRSLPRRLIRYTLFTILGICALFGFGFLVLTGIMYHSYNKPISCVPEVPYQLTLSNPPPGMSSERYYTILHDAETEFEQAFGFEALQRVPSSAAFTIDIAYDPALQSIAGLYYEVEERQRELQGSLAQYESNSARLREAARSAEIKFKDTEHAFILSEIEYKKTLAAYEEGTATRTELDTSYATMQRTHAAAKEYADTANTYTNELAVATQEINTLTSAYNKAKDELQAQNNSPTGIKLPKAIGYEPPPGDRTVTIRYFDDEITLKRHFKEIFTMLIVKDSDAAPREFTFDSMATKWFGLDSEDMRYRICTIKNS